MSDRYVLGIDLGTTNTVCAVWGESDREPRVVPIRQPYRSPKDLIADQTLPSSVGVDQAHGVLVGHYVRNQFGRINIERTINSIKRAMGTRWSKEIDGDEWSPERTSGCILAAVLNGLSDPTPGQIDYSSEPAHVVITVPASFGTEQRRATLVAAKRAGFAIERLSLFDEPTAALLHETLTSEDRWPEEERLLILDIGGGTLDASYMKVVEKDGSIITELLGRSRYNELGGDDIDLNLAALLLERYLTQNNTTVDALDGLTRRDLSAQFLSQAERVKRELCNELARVESPGERQQVRKEMQVHVGGNRWVDQIGFGELVSALSEFLPPLPSDQLQADDYTYGFSTAMRECLEFSRMHEQLNVMPSVDRVYLTGGSSNLPGLNDIVRYELSRFGVKATPRVVTKVRQPMEAVALGAARYGAKIAGFSRAKAVEFQNLMFEGIFLRTVDGYSSLVSPFDVVGANPVVKHQRFPTTSVGQQVDVDLFSGWGANDPEMRPIRRRIMRFPEPLPEKTMVTLSLSVGMDRRIELACSARVDDRDVAGEVAEFRRGSEWTSESSDWSPLPLVNSFVKKPSAHPRGEQ